MVVIREIKKRLEQVENAKGGVLLKIDGKKIKLDSTTDAITTP